MLGEKKRFTDTYAVRRLINAVRAAQLRRRWYRMRRESGGAVKTDCIIWCADGHIPHGGLADRLYGIMSLYALCKVRRVPFSIFYDVPYDVRLFLAPNEYDWSIDKTSITYDKAHAVPRCLLGGAARLPHNAVSIVRGKQVHAYCNFKNLDFINKKFGTDFSYSQLFHELFTFSPAFSAELERYKELLPQEYAGLQVRVLNAFGDFPDTVANVLSEVQKGNLEKAVCEAILRVHSESGLPVLFTSDSQVLIDKVKSHFSDSSIVLTIPGQITHTDSSAAGNSYEAHKKTFIDLFLLGGGAKELYQIENPHIYKSGFSTLAAKISGKEVRFISENEKEHVN